MQQYTIHGDTSSRIAGSAERGIREGRIRPGDRLPPIRDLAGELGVSAGTVASAYRRLRERGLAVGAGRAGTHVAERPSLPLRLTTGLPKGIRDLSDGNPDPSHLPRLPAIRPSVVLYGTEPKVPKLVEVVRAQFEADRIPVGSVAVVGGALDGIERVLGAHLRSGDRVGVEDPCFTRVLDLLAALGLDREPIAIDERGPVPRALAAALERGIDALVVTPRAQNPTGAALDPVRARELRRVLAGRPELLLVEDDHAGPIAGAPAASLCHSRLRWAVIRSYAKALGPDLRLAALTGDEETVARVEGRQLLGTGWVSHLLQHIVADALAEPAVGRLLAGAERAYAERRTALLAALADRGIPATGSSGLNVWVPVAEESATVQALFAEGWAVAPGERFRLAAPPAVRVTISRLGCAEAAALADAVARIAGQKARRYTA